MISPFTERFPLPTKPRAAELFMSSWETLPSEQRMLDLEDRLGRDLISGAELVKIVPQLSSLERGELGMFIGALLPAEPFAAAFFACWGDIPYEEQMRLAKRFVEEESDRAFLLMPFIELESLREHDF